MDFMDLIIDSADEYLTGCFYKKRPKTKEDGCVRFNYKQLDPNSRVFGKILGEVRADRASYAIKTNDMCGFNIGGYIVTQNGLIWQITEVITNEEAKGSNDALRWFKKAVNAECSVRMVQVDNLYDIEDTYTDACEITVTLKVATDVTKNFRAYANGSEEELEYAIKGSAYIFEVKKGSYVDISTVYNPGGQGAESVKHRISADKTTKSKYSVTYEK